MTTDVQIPPPLSQKFGADGGRGERFAAQGSPRTESAPTFTHAVRDDDEAGLLAALRARDRAARAGRYALRVELVGAPVAVRDAPLARAPRARDELRRAVQLITEKRR